MQCRYTEIAQRIFKYSDIQNTSLTLDKIMNSLVYRMLFYVNTYGSYKLSKNSLVFLAYSVVKQNSPDTKDEIFIAYHTEFEVLTAYIYLLSSVC